MDLNLQGRVALVVGASRGIGAGIALALAREGCDIAFTHHDDGTSAEAVATQVMGLGRRCLVEDSDAASFDAAATCIARIEGELGCPDILVYNAGIARDRVSWKMSEQEWDAVLAVNLKGCFNYGRHIGQRFREHGRGVIVNIASINALRGKFGQANYTAAKAGMIGLTRTLARELGGHGVRVNCVAPGMVTTDLTRSLPEEIVAAAREEAALGQLGSTDDIADAVLFLCSDRASHITGVCLPVDGGQLA